MQVPSQPEFPASIELLLTCQFALLLSLLVQEIWAVSELESKHCNWDKFQCDKLFKHITLSLGKLGS